MSFKTGFYEGRLGIGLSSTMGMGDGNPRYPLDINGDIRLTGSIVNGDGQVLSLVPQESLWTIGNSNLSYTGGNVGIGTANPQTKLQIGEIDNVTSYISNSEDAVCVMHSTATSSTVLNDPQPCLILGRPGTSGQTQTSAAIFNIHRYENNSVNARTQLSINLLHGGNATTNNVLVCRSNGFVGIGTASPDYKLDIAGGWVRIGSGYDLVWGSSNCKIGGVLNGDLKLSTNQIARLTVKQDGNVGIGTENPIGKLHIYKHGAGDGDPGGEIILSRYHTNNTSGLYGSVIWTEFIGSNNCLCFSSQHGQNVAYNEQMVLTHTGNVGIGVTSPGAKLDIDNDTGTTGPLHLYQRNAESYGANDTAAPSNSSYWNYNPKGTVLNMVSRDHDQTQTNATLIAMTAYGSGGGATGVYLGNVASSSNNGPGNLVFGRRTGAHSFAETMRINKDGNVGIGTTSPSTYLVVGEDGGANATNVPGIHMKSTTSETKHYAVGQAQDRNVFLTYYANSTVANGYGAVSCYGGNNPLCLQHGGGNVGIGTTSPTNLFHIDSYTHPDTPTMRVLGDALFGNDHVAVKIRFNGGYVQRYDHRFWSHNLGAGDTGSGLNAKAKKTVMAGKEYFNTNSTTSTSYLETGTSSTGYDGGSNSWWGGFTQYRVRAVVDTGSYGIVLSNYDSESDRRIKHNIIDQSGALQKVLDIELKQYKYNNLGLTGDLVYGFIAQQVKEVYEPAIDYGEGCIHDINKYFDFDYDSSNNIIKLFIDDRDNSYNEIELMVETKHVEKDNSGNDYDNYTSTKKTYTIKNKTENYIEVDYTNKEKHPDKIFSTGHYIRDFHYIQKQRIFTLHHGAIQELYKENQELKTKVATLESELVAIKQHLGI